MKIPGEGNGYSLQYSGLENHMDCSPWGRKESDMTERSLLRQYLTLRILSDGKPEDKKILLFSNYIILRMENFSADLL